MNVRDRAENLKLDDHFFRHQYAKLVAVLTAYFGLKEVAFVEDVVQDTLLAASEQWSVKGFPENPEGWLMDVAKKKTINALKRNQLYQTKIKPVMSRNVFREENMFDNDFVEDSTLKMLFCVCHPDLPKEAQISLSLRTLCGFSVPEIARALFTSTANINKRLYRAKKRFREGNLSFDLPGKGSFQERSTGVFRIIYLLFSEGYYSSLHEDTIRIELCFEAIRLLEAYLKAYPDSAEANGLMALLLFQTARIESRKSGDGLLIQLQYQDRTLWDKELIGRGMDFLTKSTESNQLNVYQIQAGIAAEHAIAKSFGETNWVSVYKQYEILEKMDPNGIVALNKCIANYYSGNRESAIKNALQLTSHQELENYIWYELTLATFYAEEGDQSTAIKFFQKALSIAISDSEVVTINQRMKDYGL